VEMLFFFMFKSPHDQLFTTIYVVHKYIFNACFLGVLLLDIFVDTSNSASDFGHWIKLDIVSSNQTIVNHKD
jgi:hypothetical protein